MDLVFKREHDYIEGHRIEKFKIEDGCFYFLADKAEEWERVPLNLVSWGSVYSGGLCVFNLFDAPLPVQGQS